MEQASNSIRGIRNNNPFNVEPPPNAVWKGQIGMDGRFPIFDTAQNGIRAGMVNYFQDFFVDGIKTLEGLGEDNTPVSDNPGSYLGQYGRALGSLMGIPSNLPFDIVSQRYNLAKAVIKLECSINPYPEAVLKAGVDEALEHARARGWLQ